MRSLTYLTKRGHARGRNSPLFHRHLWAKRVFPCFFAGWFNQDGGWAERYSSPKEVTGTITGTLWHAELKHGAPLAQGKSPLTAAGRWLHCAEDT